MMTNYKTFTDFEKDYKELEDGYLCNDGVVKYISNCPEKQGDFLAWANTVGIEEFALIDFDKIPDEFKPEWYNVDHPSIYGMDDAYGIDDSDAWTIADQTFLEDYAENKTVVEIR